MLLLLLVIIAIIAVVMVDSLFLMCPAWLVSVLLINSAAFTVSLLVGKPHRLFFIVFIFYSGMTAYQLAKLEHQQAVLAQLPQQFIATLTIDSLIAQKRNVTTFTAKIKKFPNRFHLKARSSRVLLRWYGRTPHLHLGQTWQLNLSKSKGYLKQNYGNRLWPTLYSHHQVARLTVRPYPQPKLIQEQCATRVWRVACWRDFLHQHMLSAPLHPPHLAVLLALTLGSQYAIATEQWQVLRRTGTTHLVAISGLHLSILAWGLGGILSILLRRFNFSIRVPRQVVTSLITMPFVAIYCQLAGFRIPVLRATGMALLTSSQLLCRDYRASWVSLCVTLLVLLVWDPLISLQKSTWLSFIAVAALVLGGSGRLQRYRVWQQGMHCQWIVWFGLLPCSLWLFQGVSLAALVANLVAIPVVSLLIVPCCLLGAGFAMTSEALYPAAWFCWQLASVVWQCLFKLLTALSQMPGAYLTTRHQGLFLLGCLSVSVVWGLLPRGTPGRFFAGLTTITLLIISLDWSH